ncbi:MAG TPA: hypothetical protein PJ992_13345, partial [Arachnia sp.]|nr:hypothetical protein [Arachnia sp.]
TKSLILCPGIAPSSQQRLPSSEDRQDSGYCGRVRPYSDVGNRSNTDPAENQTEAAAVFVVSASCRRAVADFTHGRSAGALLASHEGVVRERFRRADDGAGRGVEGHLRR